jgi:hypothetical protein
MEPTVSRGDPPDGQSIHDEASVAERFVRMMTRQRRGATTPG